VNLLFRSLYRSVLAGKMWINTCNKLSLHQRPLFYTSQTKMTLDHSKEAAEGLLAIADFVPGQSDVNKKYAEAFKKEYNEEYDTTSAWVYDALNILVEAIKTAGEDRAKIREAILALKGYQGVLGTFSFTPNGDGLHEVSVVQIEQGKPRLLKLVSVKAK